MSSHCSVRLSQVGEVVELAVVAGDRAERGARRRRRANSCVDALLRFGGDLRWPARCSCGCARRAASRISSRCLFLRSSTLSSTSNRRLAQSTRSSRSEALPLAGRRRGRRSDTGRPAPGIPIRAGRTRRWPCSWASSMNCAGSSSRDFVRRAISTPNLSCSQAQAVLHAVVGLQVAGARRQIDLARSPRGPSSISSSARFSRPIFFRSRSRRLRPQRVLTNVASASQFHSLSSSSLGQVFFDRIEDLRLGHAAGFVVGEPLGVVEIGVAEVAWRRARTCSRLPAAAANDSVPYVGVEELAKCCVDLLVDHLDDQIAAVDAVENPLAEAVDALPLLVHHFVVFEQVLADFEVALFDLLLGAFDAAARPCGFRSLRLPSCRGG